MQTAPCPTCGTPLPPGTSCPKDGAEVPFVAGTLVSKFILEKKLGQGGMGEVWRARNPDINKRVAIKFLSPQLAFNARAVARFKREALAVNEVRHRNLVDVFDFGELPDGRPYLVMEYLEGSSLAQYLADNGPPPFSLVLHLIGELCRGLHAAHERGVIHRDLKPDNIFLVFEPGTLLPFVKILDLGIAKLTATPGNETLTQTGAVFGTPAYMSPEQCEAKKELALRSDLYSLGIILFELLSGKTPFAEPGEASVLIMAKQMSMKAPAPSTKTSRALPKSLDAFVSRTLAKRPEERPKSALDFYQELSEASGTLRDEALQDLQNLQPLRGSKSEQERTADYFAAPAKTKQLTMATPLPRRKMAATVLAVLFGAALLYWLFQTKEAPILPSTISVPPLSTSVQATTTIAVASTSTPSIEKPKVKTTPTLSAEQLMSKTKDAVTKGNCSDGLKYLGQYQKQYGTNNADFWWYKAFCSRGSNIESTCASYQKFIKLAKSDPRVDVANKYISANKCK